jgi:phosphopantetheinyl transferase
MPLFWIDSFSAAGAVAIWHITEEEIDLEYHAGDQKAPGEVTHPRKRLEWLAGRAATRILTQRYGHDEFTLSKDGFGKPYFHGLTAGVSLTHSYPYAASVVHERNSVGIDLEQPSAKILKIARRFLGSSELEDAGTDIRKLTVYWCAKEALYKWWGKKEIHFARDLFVHPFKKDEFGYLTGEVRKQREVFSVPLYYRAFPDFVMAYTQPAA